MNLFMARGEVRKKNPAKPEGFVQMQYLALLKGEKKLNYMCNVSRGPLVALDTL